MKILTIVLTAANLISALFVVWVIVMEVVFQRDLRLCLRMAEEKSVFAELTSHVLTEAESRKRPFFAMYARTRFHRLSLSSNSRLPTIISCDRARVIATFRR